MGLKEKYITFLINLGYDGWFSLFFGATIVMIMAPFLPMFTAVIFGFCLPWFVEFVQWFCKNMLLGIETKQTIKIPIMSLIGSGLGLLISYFWINNPMIEIMWF